MKDIKVAYFRTQFWFGLEAGGSVSHTAGVLKGFKDNNCDVKIFSNEHFLGIRNYNHYVLIPALFKEKLAEIGEFVYNFYSYRYFKKKIKEFNPSFIYHRLSCGTFFVSKIAKDFKIPIILEVNGFGDWLSIFYIYKKNLIKDFLNNIFRRKILSLIENSNFRNSSVIITPSQVLKNDLTEIGIPGEKILVIPNGVDVNKFDYRISMSNQSKEIKKELKIDRDKKIVGFVGTFGPWHGIENLVSAISSVKGKNKDRGIIFLLMGDGVLKRYAVDKIGKFNNVIFTGNIPYSEIQYYLSICDVLVSPHSLQPGGREFIGSPTKIFEYMAMGKGIVASNLGQIGEVLENNRTAILVEPNNVGELVNGILKLVDDKEIRLKLGMNAAREVREKYTWDRNMKKLLTFLTENKIIE